MEEPSFRRIGTIAQHINPDNTNKNGPPVIIGGMVLDIHAKCNAGIGISPGTTVPGQVMFVKGGVARNVAECISRLGVKPFIISVVGQDLAGDYLLDHWRGLGLEISGIHRCSKASTPVVSNLFDSKGEIAAAVADVWAVEDSLSKEWIQQFHCHIGRAPLLMIDANLHPLVLEATCQIAMETGTPVWFEPVSVAKSVKMKTLAKYITFVSPNEAELVAMAEGMSNLKFAFLLESLERDGKLMDIEEIYRLFKPVLKILLEEGVKFIALTLGSRGVLLCSKKLNNLKEIHGASLVNDNKLFWLKAKDKICCQEEHSINQSHQQEDELPCLHYPSLPARVSSLTGAGDCFVGGALAALCRGKNVIECLAFGVAVAKQAVESSENVPINLSPSLVSGDAHRILLLVKRVDL